MRTEGHDTGVVHYLGSVGSALDITIWLHCRCTRAAGHGGGRNYKNQGGVLEGELHASQ